MKINISCAVLLAAYNGENWIEEQIQSILKQKNIDVHIYVSLDISNDSTIEILKKIIVKDKRVILLPYGEKFGNAAKNFYRLIKDVDFTNYDFISLSDQDDIWKENKLNNSWNVIKENKYAAFSSNVLAFWPNGKKKLIKKSQPQVKYDYFFESAGPGCSFAIKIHLALNLKKFLIDNYSQCQNIDLHDWLIYAYSRYNDYKWHISDEPLILYRQHQSNYIGARIGLKAYRYRLKKVLGKWYKEEIRKIYRCVTGNENDIILKKKWLFRNIYNLRRRNMDKILLTMLIVFNLL